MAGASLTIGGSLDAGTVSRPRRGRRRERPSLRRRNVPARQRDHHARAGEAGRSETISGVIADQTGSGGTGANAGAGGLILDGAGTLDLDAANTFTGGATIDQGVLELAKARRRERRNRLRLDQRRGRIRRRRDLANTIIGFGGSDEIDFAKVEYAAGDHAVDNAGKVAIETSAGTTIGTFDVSGTYTSANFDVSKDPSGDVLVTYAATATPAAQ